MLSKLMYHCDKVSELLEKKRVASLTRYERFQVWFHMWMCPPCNEYQEQIEVMDKVLPKVDLKVKKACFSEEEKQAMKKALKEP